VKVTVTVTARIEADDAPGEPTAEQVYTQTVLNPVDAAVTAADLGHAAVMDVARMVEAATQPPPPITPRASGPGA
jgi:hypothetical protein